MFQIEPGDGADPDVRALLTLHLTTARANTAIGSAHALDLGQLQAPGIRFWTIRDGAALLGFGALKRLSPSHGEIKSMHTAQAARRRGAAAAMLRHIIAAARADGVSRLSLETGSWPYFEPAHALYRAHGFVECGPFQGYAPDPNSLFMTQTFHDPEPLMTGTLS